MMLNEKQAAHIKNVPNTCREAMADFLARGVEVFIARQNEVSDAPTFAIQVVEQSDFWIECAESVQEAKELAEQLGLRVVEINKE